MRIRWRTFDLTTSSLRMTTLTKKELHTPYLTRMQRGSYVKRLRCRCSLGYHCSLPMLHVTDPCTFSPIRNAVAMPVCRARLPNLSGGISRNLRILCCMRYPRWCHLFSFGSLPMRLPLTLLLLLPGRIAHPRSTLRRTLLTLARRSGG